MPYREDLDAAVARADAAEREVQELRERVGCKDKGDCPAYLLWLRTDLEKELERRLTIWDSSLMQVLVSTLVFVVGCGALALFIYMVLVLFI